MGDLFDQFSPVKAEYKNKKLEELYAYEESFMRLVRNYKTEIAEIGRMMRQLRQEREEFYGEKFPKIKQSIQNDEVISNDAKEKWIMELRANVEKSFKISESLIEHYVTSNLAEFKNKMQLIIDKV